MLINTSNTSKQKEFSKFLNVDNFTSIDLPEIKSKNKCLVSAHKALMSGDGILIDDTALEISGANVGTDIKWLLSNIDSFSGRDASFYCTLAIKHGKTISVFQGRVLGKIVTSKGTGFGFDNNFLPFKANKTLGQYKPNKYNARFLAIQNFKKGVIKRTYTNLKQWTGDWQND